MKIKEQWKDIPGYEGIYQVSTLGEIRNIKTGRILKQVYLCGYKRIGLYNKEHKYKNHFVHRLVAETFIPNPDNLPQVNHRNELKDENVVSNLEWCTQKYNINYGTAIQRRVENQRKPILQFTKTGIFVKEYYSISEANKAFNPKCNYPATGNIGRCLQGKCKSAYGFKWKYKED